MKLLQILEGPDKRYLAEVILSKRILTVFAMLLDLSTLGDTLFMKKSYYSYAFHSTLNTKHFGMLLPFIIRSKMDLNSIMDMKPSASKIYFDEKWSG